MGKMKMVAMEEINPGEVEVEVDLAEEGEAMVEDTVEVVVIEETEDTVGEEEVVEIADSMMIEIEKMIGPVEVEVVEEGLEEDVGDLVVVRMVIESKAIKLMAVILMQTDS